MNDLKNKRVLITGASRGIGRAIALHLAEKGADVAISYSNSAAQAEEIIQKIKESGSRGIAIQADNSDPDAIKKLVEQTISAFGGIDILINNAAITWHGALEDMSLDDVNSVLNVNLRGAILTTQAVIPHLKRGGRILFMGSAMAERISTTGLTLYATTKSAQIALTKGLARELGPRGITVNLIQPGATETDGNPAVGEHADELRRLTALGHYGTPQDVAETVAFIASDAAGQITGSTVTIDGGLNA